METVDCLLCGHGGSTPRVSGWDRMCGVQGDYTLVECDRCGFLYLSPRPDAVEIARHYPADYPFYGSFYDQSPYIQAIGKYEMNKRYQVTANAAVGGRDVLDVGCSVGDFLATMRNHGWSVRGIEPDAGAAAQAREQHGIDVFNGYLDDAPFDPGSFDAVTMWEVLEHTPRPVDTLRQIFELLRPGGAVVVSVPNRDSWQSTAFGTNWIGNDFPRHFSVFSPKHMRQAMRTAGFEDPQVLSQRGRLGTMHNEIACLFGSVDLWLKGGDHDTRAQRFTERFIVPVIANPAGVVPFFILTLPASIAIRKLGRGSQMVAYARKPLAA